MTILLVFVRRSGRTALVCTADKTSCFQSGWRLIQRYSWGCFANSRGKIVPAISVSETNPWNEFPLSPKSTCCLASRCWHLLLGTYLPSRDALLSLVTREKIIGTKLGRKRKNKRTQKLQRKDGPPGLDQNLARPVPFLLLFDRGCKRGVKTQLAPEVCIGYPLWGKMLLLK